MTTSPHPTSSGRGPRADMHIPDPADDHSWVHAKPFRQQLFHLCAAADLSAEMVAVVSQVPWRTVRRLMTGRPGRIRVKDARRLMALRADRLRSQMVQPTEPSFLRDEIVRLVGRGATINQIAAEIRVSGTVVRSCLAGDNVPVTWAVLWRARAAVLTRSALTPADRCSSSVDPHVLLAA